MAATFVIECESHTAAAELEALEDSEAPKTVRKRW